MDLQIRSEEGFSGHLTMSVYDQNDMMDMFEAGANYVLDEVKILLNSQRFVDNPSQELFELIEQLKK